MGPFQIPEKDPEWVSSFCLNDAPWGLGRVWPALLPSWTLHAAENKGKEKNAAARVGALEQVLSLELGK